MTIAQNISLLADGGCTNQALRDANNQSLWLTTSADGETSVYGFADGSAVFVCGKNCREATPEEIAEYQ